MERQEVAGQRLVELKSLAPDAADRKDRGSCLSYECDNPYDSILTGRLPDTTPLSVGLGA